MKTKHTKTTAETIDLDEILGLKPIKKKSALLELFGIPFKHTQFKSNDGYFKYCIKNGHVQGVHTITDEHLIVEKKYAADFLK